MHFKNIIGMISLTFYTSILVFLGVHEVFTVFYVVDVFSIFQHIIQPLIKLKLMRKPHHTFSECNGLTILYMPVSLLYSPKSLANIYLPES